MNGYTAYIPVVNRPDLLLRAIRSLEPFTQFRAAPEAPVSAMAETAAGMPAPKFPRIGRIVAIDNSVEGGGPLRGLAEHAIHGDPDLRRALLAGRIVVTRPPVPLTFAQTQNLIQRWAREDGDDAAIFAHSDMEATPEAVARFLDAVDDSIAERGEFPPARPWGVVFTHYDVLCAFSPAAIERVGAWDPFIPWYFADNDWYRRLRLAGFAVVEAGGEGIAHNDGRGAEASATMRSDPALARMVSMQTQASAKIYAAKWGGSPGRERYTVPFGLGSLDHVE